MKKKHEWKWVLLVVMTIALGTILWNYDITNEKKSWETNARSSLTFTSTYFYEALAANANIEDNKVETYRSEANVFFYILENNKDSVTEENIEEFLSYMEADSFYIINTDGTIEYTTAESADTELVQQVAENKDNTSLYSEYFYTGFDTSENKYGIYCASKLDDTRIGFVTYQLDMQSYESLLLHHDSYIFSTDTDDEFNVFFNTIYLDHGDANTTSDYTPFVNGEEVAEFTFQGRRCYGIAYQANDYGYYVHAISLAKLYQRVQSVFLIQMGGILACALIILAYGHFTRRYDNVKETVPETFGSKHLLFNKTLAIKMIPLCVLSLILVSLSCYYGENLLDNTTTVLRIERLQSLLQEIEERDTQLTEENNEKIEKALISQAEMVEYLLRITDESSLSRQYLSQISDTLGLDFILVYDADGNLIATDSQYGGFTISTTDPDNPSYVLAHLLNGSDPKVCDAWASEDDGHAHKYVGVCRRTLSGEPNGVVLVSLNSDLMEANETYGELNTCLSYMQLGDNYILAAVDTENDLITYDSRSSYVNQSAASLTSESDALASGFKGIAKLHGNDCVTVTSSLANHSIVIGSKVDAVNYGNLKSCLLTTLFSLIIFVLSGLCATLMDELPENTNTQNILSHQKGVVNEDLYRNIWKNSAAQNISIHQIKDYFTNLNPKKQITNVCWCVFLSYMVIFVCALNRNSEVLNFLISQQWQRGVDIFALSYCLLYIATIVALVFLLRFVLSLLAQLSSSYGETVIRMLRNSIGYVAALIIIFKVAYYMGVDVNSILASVGIVSVIIGLGAQKSIGDILAGIFILFEGNVSVGDVVSVNGTYGIIKEIGVRTTNIVTRSNDIVTMNNSTINSITNLSRFGSSVYITIPLAVDSDTSNAMRIIQKEFKRIEDAHEIKTATWGPICLGVHEIKSGSNVIDCAMGCEEIYKEQSLRDLLQSVDRILKENHIERGK